MRQVHAARDYGRKARREHGGPWSMRILRSMGFYRHHPSAAAATRWCCRSLVLPVTHSKPTTPSRAAVVLEVAGEEEKFGSKKQAII